MHLSSLAEAHLNLGHVGGPAAASTAAAHVGGSRTRHEHRDNDRCHVARPGEPEESNRGLGFTAALRLVVGAIGDLIAIEIFL